MPAASGAAAPGFTIDHAAHTIRLTRRLTASRSQVFSAWTQPEHLSCWWDAAGERLARCEIDLRVGGSFMFVSRSHPEMPFVGTYVEITPPSLLVFEAMGALGRVVIEEMDGGTQLTVEIVCRTADQLAQFMSIGVHAGTSQTLDNLVAHLAEQAAPAA